MAKTRLLFVVNNVEYGGTEKHLLELVRRLDVSKVACTIVCYGPDFYTQRLLDRPDVHVARPNQVTPKSALSYWSTFRRFTPHVIVFVKGWLDSFPLQAYLAARLSKAKLVAAIELLIAEPIPPKVMGPGIWNHLRRLAGWRARHVVSYVWMKRLAGLLVDTTICISDAVRDRLVNEYRYSPHKTVSILMSVDLNYYVPADRDKRQSIRSLLSLDPHGSIVVCIARLDPRKRIDVLVDAFSILSQRHPCVKCLIVGSGLLERELFAKAIKSSLSESIRFVGFAEDVRHYLEAADIYVSPSEKEGFGLTLIEAMACGLPCIATDIGGHDEIVLHGNTGLLVRPGSAEELAEAIEDLLTHREERTRMGINGRKRVEEHFNIDDMMMKYRDVLLGGL